jgi:GT2 family glycosyltransferase
VRSFASDVTANSAASKATAPPGGGRGAPVGKMSVAGAASDRARRQRHRGRGRKVTPIDPQHVAVVVVDWNSGDLLERCLLALRRQTVRPASVIVVDNASAEPTASRVPGEASDVEIVRMAENLGFAAGTNLGIARAPEARWIALLNPDAFPEPEWLERLLAAAEAHPAHSFFASRQVMAGDPARLDGAGDAYGVSGIAWRRGFGRPAAAAPDAPEEVFGPCAAAALYRRDVLLEVGGLDEGFFCYFEDVDLAFRLRLAGHRCLYVPDAVVRHVGSASKGRRSDFAVYHGHRNLVWTFVKNMPAPLAALYWPHHLLLNLTSLAYFTVRRQGRPIWKAKWDALRGLPRVLRQRREVQAARRASARDLRRVMARGLRGFGLGR